MGGYVAAVSLCGSLIWGIVAWKVADNRGYHKDGSFWWGFFLWFIGVIVVFSKPARNDGHVYEPSGSDEYGYAEAADEEVPGEEIPGEEFAGEESLDGENPDEEQVEYAWCCPRCGRLNNTTICECGGVYRGGIEMIERGEKRMLAEKDEAEKQPKPAVRPRRPQGSAAPGPAAKLSPEKEAKFAEIKAYKELLDSGIISQEEFDRKKAELLGL